MRDINKMPVLRMSLENVAKDFHMRIIENNEEVHSWIEANLEGMLQDFINRELPALAKSIIHESCRNKLRNLIVNNEFDNKIEKAVSNLITENAEEMIQEEIDDYDLVCDVKDKLSNSRIFNVLKNLLRD